MIKELLCVEVAFLMAVGKVSSPDSPPALCCAFMNPTLATKIPSVEYLLYICHHQLHTTHKEKIWCWLIMALSHFCYYTGCQFIKSCLVIECRYNEINT
jgi:hypothetical protein